MGIGKALAKILEGFVCGTIVGCIVSMTPCILGILIMLIPGLGRFYESSIKVICLLATSLSIIFFCYLEFIRKPASSGTEDQKSPVSYKLAGFAGEILGSFFPIIIIL